MSSNGIPNFGETENSLEKIKRQLASGSGRYQLQGPLLKRSENLRKWNERWVILDPTTGKMEYKTRRNESVIKGTIIFDSTSTIAMSPVNFHGLPKYEGCCIYIGTPQKKEYFLCAETPGAARAWVSTLHATQLVLRAHKEAVNSLSGNGSPTLGTVATVVAAANSTAMESAKEIEAAMRISMRAALGVLTNRKNDGWTNDGQLDDLTIMKLRTSEEEVVILRKERDQLLKQRDSAFQEAHLWRSELGKARERVVILEAAVFRAEERARVLYADAEAKQKDAVEKDLVAAKEKEELVAHVNHLQAQVQSFNRQQSKAKQVFEEKAESSPGADNTLPLTKHVDLSEDNVDKACLSECHDFQLTDARIADVKEISTEAEGSSLDIPVVNLPVNDQSHGGSSLQP
ncbi:uncharacterized protein LOC143892552 isoform X3 [Tasmannia lanceolata]|uniref:uncharacterized protein LOC143892552 isoform X3 n=1 Tax=Tasmannia lanceolata TaxID=3420 RepID=UPI0040631731